MPRVTSLNTNFTAGELSPRLRGRVDIERYQNGAEEILNGWPVIHGGVIRRHGSLYVAATKDSTKRSRLIAFVFNLDQTYVLEFGDLYMRVFKDGAQVLSAPSTPYEIVTTYTEAMLDDISFVQGADTLIIAHPSVAPRRLRRFGDAIWDLGDIPFDPAPFDEVGLSPATACTLSSAAVGSRTFTAGAAAFLTADVGRQITSGAGIADITAYSSTTVVTADVTTAFASTSLASGAWKITGTPQATCTPSAVGTVGGNIDLTLSAAGWRSSADVGKFVEINGGLVEITTVTSTTILTAKVHRVLTSTTAAPAGAWVLKGSVWSATLGYPRAVALYQQRLIFAGTTTYPGYVWGSKTGALFDFTLGTNDDDAFAFSISGEVNPIRQIVARDALILITGRGEITMQGGIERPLTPTNVQIKSRSTYGTGSVRPIVVRDEVLFVQRAGRKVRSIKTDDAGGYIAPDIAVLSEHITEGGITDMAFQQEYDSLVWCVRDDGSLPTCAFDRDQEVVGWALQTTDGLFESVCVIPVDGRDQVWAIVKRTIDGSTVRYVEVFDPDLLLDCAITGTSVGGDTVWTGLDHLEGKTVQCLADDVYVGTFVVSSGEITLPREANDVVIGLPYTSRLKPLPPEIPGSGSSQGSAVSVSEVVVRMLNTSSCKINGDVVAFRQFGEGVLDQPIPEFTGLKRMEVVGWSNTGDITTIEQDEPLPWHILSITRKLTVND